MIHHYLTYKFVIGIKRGYRVPSLKSYRLSIRQFSFVKKILLETDRKRRTKLKKGLYSFLDFFRKQKIFYNTHFEHEVDNKF